MPEVIDASLYDFPKYYDLLFGSDWKAEFDFLQAAFEKHARRRVRRVFEPACGTGRLLIKLAQAGYDVGGNDLNPKAVAYCNARLKRHGFGEPVTVGDMSNFSVRNRFDAAFNTINSFRHLASQAQAESHLKCMAEAANKGGVYVLGLHLIPTGSDRVESESWSARRGNLVVNSQMWSKAIDTRRRNETLGMTLDVYTPTRHFRINDEMSYRTYNKWQMAALIDRVTDWEVVETYDFAYRIDEPVTIDGTTEDVVYILRRK